MAEITKKLTCFTIGHSNHEVQKFIGLLKTYAIQYVIDVRSVPYSQRNPQFNREFIKVNLEEAHIIYIFMGNLLGARYNDPALFFSDKQVVDFGKVRKLDSFKRGIERVLDGLKRNYKIALMCSEKDPFNCHRFVLVSRELVNKGVLVKHILANGEIILNEALENKLIAKYKLSYKQPTFFGDVKSKADVIEEGYILRNKDIGYLKEEVVNRK